MLWRIAFGRTKESRVYTCRRFEAMTHCCFPRYPPGGIIGETKALTILQFLRGNLRRTLEVPLSPVATAIGAAFERFERKLIRPPLGIRRTNRPQAFCGTCNPS
jgi:hypothetical protein